MKNKETVGKVAVDLASKTPVERNPIELEREMHTDYDKNIYEAVDRGKKDYPGDFFIVVETKKERLLQNVLRNYFMVRQSCPTPNYDQTVYRYIRADEIVEFLWVVPARDVCFYLKDNALDVVDEEKVLLRYVLNFSDGTLYKLAQQLNNEITETIKGE